MGRFLGTQCICRYGKKLSTERIYKDMNSSRYSHYLGLLICRHFWQLLLLSLEWLSLTTTNNTPANKGCNVMYLNSLLVRPTVSTRVNDKDIYRMGCSIVPASLVHMCHWRTPQLTWQERYTRQCPSGSASSVLISDRSSRQHDPLL